MQIASSAGHGGTGLSIIPIHGKQRQEEHEFRAILHCMPRPYLKPNKKPLTKKIASPPLLSTLFSYLVHLNTPGTTSPLALTLLWSPNFNSGLFQILPSPTPQSKTLFFAAVAWLVSEFSNFASISHGRSANLLIFQLLELTSAS